MKKIFFTLLTFSGASAFAQTTPVQNSKAISDCQEIIRANNLYFFISIFEDYYKKGGKKNESYFQSIGFASKNDIKNYEKLNTILQNILADTSRSAEDHQLAREAFAFNNAYIALFGSFDESRNFFDVQFDAAKAEEIRKNFSKVDVSQYDALQKDKSDFLNKIEGYERLNCELQKEITRKQKINDGGEPKKIGDLLLNDAGTKYAHIPYLQKELKIAAANVKGYNLGRLGCKENKYENEK